MATRLLVIHRQLVFAVTIKQALEQTGGFAVHPFTKAEAAFEFLRDHPQDIALVDFILPGRSGSRIIQQLRSLQPDIAIIVTPQLSEADERSYGVQGSLNSPFSARDLLPLLQNALDETPSDSLSHEPPSVMGGQMTTSNLGEQKRIKRQQMGTTQNLGDHSPESANVPSQTHILPSEPDYEGDKPQTKPLANNPLKPQKPFTDDSAPASNDGVQTATPGTRKNDPFQTRNLGQDDPDSNDVASPENMPYAGDNLLDADRYKTRNLQDADEISNEQQLGTRIFPEIPQADAVDSLQTRQLHGDEEEDPVQTRNLGKQQPVDDPGSTRQLDNAGSSAAPPTPPEFSSLDLVLQSFAMEEPVVDDMDTPAVPTKDSDALRQFMATSNNKDDAETFDDVLGAIEPNSTEAPKQQRQVDFEGLVKSMQRNEPQRRLPDRQQQLMDFVLTTGMDSVLDEIEKTKTGTLPKVTANQVEESRQIPPPTTGKKSSFQKLAQEEPPLPTLEENGTVSDLLVGIADSNFRDVLALLNDTPESNTPTPPRGTKKDTPAPVQTDSAYLDDFLHTTNIDSDSVPVVRQNRIPADQSFDFDFNDDTGGATVAQVVLRSTQENTSTPGEFSLDQLMSDINDRLTTHKLIVRPLPSWDMDTTAFHTPVKDDSDSSTGAKGRPSQRMPGEPSFLPEMFPPDENAAPELPLMEAEVAEVWTTVASEPSLEAIESIDANDETRMEPGYFDEAADEEPVIDAEMFSGILENTSDYDDVPRYDDEAESSSHQSEYQWDEPAHIAEVTEQWQEPEIPDEATPNWAEQNPVADDDPQPATAAGDDWETLEASPVVEESFMDMGEFAAVESQNPAERADTNWESNWDVPETVSEPNAQAVIDEWDLPAPVDETSLAAANEEARIAQLALNLTQVSLEVSAEGTILTRDNQIIAVAGHLSQDDTIELATVINNDWGTGGQGARLRFITLPSSGKEYMLYSTGTEDELILSMIFAGTTPLRVIRHQGQRLLNALGDVPEQAAKPATNAIATRSRREMQPVEVALEPYAYVWLVQNPEQGLSSAVAQSISAGLMTQLSEMNWQIEQLEVQEEYIYLLANVPGETPSYSIVRDLKQRAATIAQKQDSNLETQALWADSYLVLSPGRELAADEIQEFIDFQRMM